MSASIASYSKKISLKTTESYIVNKYYAENVFISYAIYPVACNHQLINISQFFSHHIALPVTFSATSILLL